MSQWLQSGFRRDLCILLYGEERSGQALKTAIERRYDRRFEPRRFYGALDQLVDKGFVEEHTDGVHDIYALTEPGRRSVERQFEWMDEQLAQPSST